MNIAGKSFNKSINRSPLTHKITNISILMVSELDECSSDPSPCDENALCTNSDGSYSCTCKQGFTGDGTLCEGAWEFVKKLVLLIMINIYLFQYVVYHKAGSVITSVQN